MISLVTDFLAAVFFATFLAADFLAGAFFATFLVADFFTTFLVVDFLTAAFLAAFLVSAFLAAGALVFLIVIGTIVGCYLLDFEICLSASAQRGETKPHSLVSTSAGTQRQLRGQRTPSACATSMLSLEAVVSSVTVT